MYNNAYAIERPNVHSHDDKKLKIILVIIIMILGIQFFWLFIISPRMPLAKISISGIPGINESVLLSHAGIDGQTTYMSINVEYIENALLAIPAIHFVRVEKQFPNRLALYLESRRPAAMILVSAGDQTVPAFIDKTGVLFGIGDDYVLEKGNVPLISGLSFEGMYAGMQLPRIYYPLFSQLETLSLEAPELLATISEIRINHREYSGFDLTLFPVHKDVRVRVNNNITEESIRYILLMLDVFSARSINAAEIDFRTGVASYKEAHSG